MVSKKELAERLTYVEISLAELRSVMSGLSASDAVKRLRALATDLRSTPPEPDWAMDESQTVPHNQSVTIIPEPPVVYRIPGQPVTERRVRMHGGDDLYAHRVWTRGRDGSWTDEDGRDWSWSEILEFADVELIPLTPEEQADAELYGPPGARWGVIGDPCPYLGCALWTGHLQQHKNFTGDPLGVTEDDGARTTAAATAQDLAEPCNCGHPDRHRFGCNRYGRTSGWTG